jgi:hypothetical protein
MTGAKNSTMRKALLIGAALAAIGGAAHAADWKIVEMTGAVRVAAPGADAAPGRQGQTLPVGTSVTTFQGGRAVLDNGLQHIVVGPNSRMTLAPEAAGGMARVMQDLGSVLFQVDKTGKPHFRVETPLLAAVVKGTTFTVDVQPQSDSVNVAEGLVEVRSNLGDLARDVPAGASGAVMRDAPGAVQVMTLTTNTGAVPAPEPVAALPPIDYRAASDGLIGGPAAPAAALAANAVAAPALAEAPAQTMPAGPAALPVTTLASQVSGAQIAVAETAGGNGAITLASATTGILAGVGGPPTAHGAGNGNGPAGGGGGLGGAIGRPIGGEGPAAGNGNGNGPGNGIGAGAGAGGPGNANSGPGNNNGQGNGNGNGGLVGGLVGAGNGNGNGNGGPGANNGQGNGNGAGGLVGGLVGGVTDTVGGLVGGGAQGNNGNANGQGNGNGQGDNGNGNGGSNLVGALVGTVTDTVGAVTGSGNSGNGVSNSNSGPGNNSGQGGGNGNGGLVGGLVGTVTDTVGAVTGGGSSGNGSSSSGSSGSGSGGSGGSGLVGGLLGALGRK